jgi:hypothetical protein
VCGLCVLAATALTLGAIANLVPLMSSGEGAILAIATFPLAVVGTVLSVRGRTSTSRRGRAIVGLLCRLVYFVLTVLEGIVLYMLAQACTRQVDGCF